MKQNKIKVEIDKIEVDDETKKRVYRNILDKAGKKKKPRKSFSAGFLRLTIPLAACVCILVVGTTFLFGEDVGFVQGANPFVSVESAKEFEKFGVFVDAPENAENVSYAVIDGNIASVSFELDSVCYILRASKKSGDFSGVSGTVISSKLFDAETNGTISRVKTTDSEAIKAYWTNGKVHFYLSTAGDVSESVVETLARELVKG